MILYRYPMARARPWLRSYAVTDAATPSRACAGDRLRFEAYIALRCRAHALQSRHASYAIIGDLPEPALVLELLPWA